MDLPELLGMPYPFTFEGKEYLVSERTPEHDALFKTHLEKEALLAIERHLDNMNPMIAQLQYDGWRKDLSTFQYGIGGATFLQAEYTPDGQKYFAYLSLKERSKSPVDLSLIDRIANDNEAWKNLQAIRSRLNDPNRQRPAADKS